VSCFDNRQSDRVLLVDAMVAVQSVKISYVYHNCIQESFTKKVESMFGSFQEGSIVFDRCIVCMPLRSLFIFEDKRQHVQEVQTVLQDIPHTKFSETCMLASSLLRFFADTNWYYCL
jgi:hypothetical protein